MELEVIEEELILLENEASKMPGFGAVSLPGSAGTKEREGARDGEELTSEDEELVSAARRTPPWRGERSEVPPLLMGMGRGGGGERAQQAAEAEHDPSPKKR